MIFLKEIPNYVKKHIKEKKLPASENRYRFGSLLILLSGLIFFFFIVRFVYIVSVGRVGTASLNEKTQQLYQGSSVVKAKRGTIYDRNGEPIAQDATSYSLYAVLDKKHLGIAQSNGKREKLYIQEKSIEDVAKVLHKILGIDKKLVRKQLAQGKNGVKQVEFGSKGKNISFAKKQEIEKALQKSQIKGIYFNDHPARMYKNEVFASHLIGYARFADEDNEEKGIVGVMGLEQAYNKELSGTDGKVVYQKNNRQERLPGTVVVDKEAVDGKDVYTTLDTGMQIYLEDLMSQVYDEYQPEGITATLMEAKTGNILAASQRPTFNPQTKEGLEGGESAPWRNLLIEEPFEPGSTMKVFTVASAIDQGKFDQNAGFMTGKIDVDGTPINDHIIGGRGWMSFRQGFAWSSNVGMVHVEQNMGAGWQEYLKRFKFGQSTNSHLANENAGLIQTKTSVDRAMTSFGQAISVTNFQMLQGFTAIANQGKMMKPNFVDRIESSTGKKKMIGPQQVGQPIKSSTSKEVLDMMTDVVEDENFGTGYGVYNIDGYRVSAKTGTAQIFENGRYIPGQYLQSVVQIAPTEHPEYIVYVTIKKPAVGAPASKMVATISNAMLKRALDTDVSHLHTKVKYQKEKSK